VTDFLKLLLPVFLSPANYSEMLKKLASFLFYEIWIATFFLREIPEINSAFQAIESTPAIRGVVSLIPGGDKLNLTGIAIGLIIASVSYAVQFHDRISDAFGIRRRFDCKHILIPLATAVGTDMTPEKTLSLTQNRDELMREVFYKYASSRADKTVVDKHDIERALDSWSWYWILIEVVPVMLVATGIASYFGAHEQAVNFLYISIFFVFCVLLFSLRLKRLARPQVSAIANNAETRANVRSVFDAL
jgi:hypothetical protein